MLNLVKARIGVHDTHHHQLPICVSTVTKLTARLSIVVGAATAAQI